MKAVPLKTIADDLNLEIVHRSSDFDDILISTKEVNRPGLQLAGYMENFPYKRMQIIGNVERSYYLSLEPAMLYERFRGILSYDIPAIIFSYGQDIDQDILDLADYYDKTILRSNFSTTKITSLLNATLENYLAEETTMHAGLLEVYGSGVLLRGESSVGKSETALDLVTKGHRLVADDVVEITKLDDKLIGRSPENIRHFLEIRGLGILNIQSLYGAGSVKESAFIDLVIQLENWDEDKEYDRLGLDDNYTEILGVKVPMLVVPVKPGRNIAMIVEVATRNQRQKDLGYNAASELNRRLLEEMNQ